MSESEHITAEDIETKTGSVRKMAAADETALHLLEDAVEIVEPFGEEAVEYVRRKSDTFFQKGAMPYGDAEMEDEAVGVYEMAQAAIRAEGGEHLRGRGTGNGFYAQSAYRRNMWRLAGMMDGVSRDELGLQEPAKMEE